MQNKNSKLCLFVVSLFICILCITLSAEAEAEAEKVSNSPLFSWITTIGSSIVGIFLFIRFIDFVKERLKRVKKRLTDSISNNIETRMLKAGAVKSELLNLMYPELNKALTVALRSHDLKNFFDIIKGYDKFQWALSNLLSQDEVEIYEGIVIIEQIPKELIPKSSLFELIKQLKKQDRLKADQTIAMIDRLRKKLD